MLKPLSPHGCWVIEVPSRVLGLELGARMTVIRLSDGGLWIGSPLEPTIEWKQPLDALGPVRFIVAPNRMHHTCLDSFAAAYPAAAIFAAEGVARLHPELSFAGVLSDEPEAAWAADIDQTPFEGAPAVNETVFFHRASRTLILTDLCFHLRSNRPPLTRLYARLSRILNKLGPTLLFRAQIKDRRAARRSIDRILQWPFERIIVAHGDIIEHDARSALQNAFSWLK